MTYSITNQCIECDRCLSACPTGAIQKTDQRYEIDPTRCNNCVGHYAIAQCWSACPTNHGCIPGITTVFNSSIGLTGSQDYWEQWFTTYNRMISRLHGVKHSEYWNDWFDGYAQRISNLLQAEHQAIGTEA
ncbi:4Fe-4S binding protein [Oculatella sp. LEGE 06141]|uniref:4Fe-4S binding protein n=1 Tax=Oculatella sp. LEGE 06141 TaxID=1828648 RepID=UPI0018809AAF|nr:4Fe-4S binding protein [Oculatella sp. LEGE 06141]MBE9182293.1 4Fe-4S binding protein [Oculatella sp. LEGE 06141]